MFVFYRVNTHDAMTVSFRVCGCRSTDPMMDYRTSGHGMMTSLHKKGSAFSTVCCLLFLTVSQMTIHSSVNEAISQSRPRFDSHQNLNHLTCSTPNTYNKRNYKTSIRRPRRDMIVKQVYGGPEGT